MAHQFTKEQMDTLNSVMEKTKAIAADSNTSYLAELWAYLSASESQLVDLMSNPQIKPPATAAGEPELGLWLYSLNNLQNGNWEEYILYEILELLEMPQTTITSTTYAQYEQTLNSGPGVIAGDGSFLSTYQYGAFDTGWDTAAKQYILYLLGEIGDQIDVIRYLFDLLQSLNYIPTEHPFVNSGGPVINIPATQRSLSMAVFGDWGAGNENATLVLNAIKSLNPDMYMHLGDVYYAGTSAEETTNLLQSLQGLQGDMFTLNSNHEMYDGANGYFDTALTSSLFSLQNGGSYFAIEYGNWILLGLDSSYFDTQSFHNLDMYMNGALYNPATGAGNPQVDFLNNLQLSGKQVVVFTHHNGISLDGTQINDPLMSQLHSLLGNRYPDFWYYGHIHDGVAYTNPPALLGLTTPSGNQPQLRCSGNAALPYGVPYFLQASSIRGIGYFAQTNARNQNIQLTNTVRNGFAMLTFSANRIVETFYEVNLNGTAVPMWANTTDF